MRVFTVFLPVPLKIRALPSYEIYAFGMSKTQAILCWKEKDKFAVN